MTKNETSLVKLRILHRDGFYKDLWVKMRHSPLIDKGDILQVMGIFEPNIKVKDAEKIFREQRKKIKDNEKNGINKTE